jgi:hypothetical protein
VSDYVSKRLAGPYAIHVATYVEGLTRLDVAARQMHGCRFADLAAGRRDDLLVATEEREGKVVGSFFSLVLAHTMEGMFSDPLHGGNAQFIGWKLIGYTGVRYVWTESDQRFGATIESDVNQSAGDARAAMLGSLPKTT